MPSTPAHPHRQPVATGGARGQRALQVSGLVLWLVAAGLHWDALQIFAWARMMQENARTLPAATAVARTFSPEGMCGMCELLQEARQQHREQTALTGHPAEKAPLLVPAIAHGRFAPPPVIARLLHPEPAAAPERREAPPVPPPRAA